MSSRRRLVRVPGSTANLGPGYDVLAAALDVQLELEVSEADKFSVDTGGLDLPTDRSNLIVSSFERLHPADRVSFEIRSAIPASAGMGSSAAAIVAGLTAADHLFELGNSKDELFELATEIEGHPDNVAASIYGGIVVCPPPGAEADQAQVPHEPPGLVGFDGAVLDPGPPSPAPARIDPPEGVEAIIVIPTSEQVPTSEARAAMPAELPLADATANVAAAAHLVLGLERSDLALIRRGLADAIHQPRRRHLYPRSMELVEAATGMGAIGATISGAGPTVMVWSYWQTSGAVVAAIEKAFGDWAQVIRVPFTPRGADVPEL